MDANTLQDAFVEHVKSGALSKAEDVAATLVELLLIQRDLGQDVRDTLVGWQARQSLLQLMHDSLEVRRRSPSLPRDIRCQSMSQAVTDRREASCERTQTG